MNVLYTREGKKRYKKVLESGEDGVQSEAELKANTKKNTVSVPMLASLRLIYSNTGCLQHIHTNNPAASFQFYGTILVQSGCCHCLCL